MNLHILHKQDDQQQKTLEASRFSHIVEDIERKAHKDDAALEYWVDDIMTQIDNGAQNTQTDQVQ